ncbi:MAG: hypothetical protein JKY25_04205 [Robiginitomaculum sp.]|nr:hypothetical protein [Robiginitomaculum sp.]
MTDDTISDEHEDEPSMGTLLDADDVNPDLSNKGVGVGFVLAGFVVASLLGGFIGIVAPKVFQHPGQEQQQREALIAKLDTLTQNADTQDKLIKNLTAQLQRQQNTLTSLKKADEKLLSTQQNQQNSIADYFEKSAAPRPPGNEEINDKPIRDKTDEAVAMAAPDIPKPVDKNKSTDVTPKYLNILMDTFPREKMLAAVLAQEKLAGKKPGWLRRTLRKHIKVREDGGPDPHSAISAAETAVNEGRIQDALDIIARLNPTVRAAAAEWVRAANKTLQ